MLPNVTLIQPGRFQRQPWKNGGGSTMEIMAATEGGRLLWRVSIAEVTGNGPFSVFPGMERVLAVIDGAGMRLSVDGASPATVTPSGGTFRFRGDAGVTCALIDSPCRVFNLMFDRTRLDGTLRRITPGEAAGTPPGGISLAYAAGGALRLKAGGHTWRIPQDHALRLDGEGVFDAGGGAPLLAVMVPL